MRILHTATSASNIFPPSMVGLKSASILTALRAGGNLVDYSGAAAEYFSSIRTPASLVLGASLGALFVNDLSDTETILEKSRAVRLCTRFYNTCVVASFLTSLCCNVMATAAGVTIIHNDFVKEAESAYALLMREFEFEFITVRLSYLASLLFFVIGISNRILIEFNLLDKNKREELGVVCCGIGAVVTQMWSYINTTLYSTQSLIGLAAKLFQLTFQRAVLEHRPLQIVSLILSALTTFFLTRVLFFKKKDNSNDVIL